MNDNTEKQDELWSKLEEALFKLLDKSTIDANNLYYYIYISDNETDELRQTITFAAKDPMYGHEILDRTFVSMQNFEQHIMDHPAIAAHMNLKTTALFIKLLMDKLYSQIGDTY